MEEWFSLYKGGTAEIEEKKSRFIAHIEAVKSVEEANEYIARIKKQYWDARHNCSAFVIGDDGMSTRCSDDGEPSGTAGRPMLEVLLGEKITNVCVVVTRYFGGTLLGTGGLVRAYQQATKAGLNNCEILKKLQGTYLTVRCSYNEYGRIQFYCNQNGHHIDSIDYADDVVVNIILPNTELEDAKVNIMDASSGRAAIDDSRKVTYAVIDGKPMIFE